MRQMLELGSSLDSMLRMTLSVHGLRMHLAEDSIVKTAFLALAVLLLGKCLFDAYQRKNLPPGPGWAWPIVGHLFILGSTPYRSLRKLALKHGELMYLRLGSNPCIIVSSGAMAKEVVINHDLQFAHRPPKLFSKLLLKNKDIVTTSFGPAWRHLRMICTSQFFTKKRLSSYEAGRAQEIHTLIKLVLRKSLSEDCVVNLPFQFRNTATNIISRMVFNKRLFVEGEDGNLEEAKQYQEIVKSHFKAYSIFVISDYVPFLSFITELQGIREKMQKIVDKIYKQLDEIIDLKGHEHRLKDLNHEPGAVHDQDFVDLLLSTPSHDGIGTLDHETIRVVVMNMLFAGAETQSTTLEWAMAHLLKYPDVMQRVQEELDEAVGTTRIVQESDLEHLPYLEAVMREVSRLQPGAPIGVNHESREARRVAGYNLPANTRLLFNIHAIHRDPSVYDLPDEFNPSRFLRHDGGNVSSGQDSFQFMPYGAGRRICPGMSLANINMVHILAHLLHSFDWRLPADQNPQELDMSETFDGVTTPRKCPLLSIAQPRKPAFLY